MSVTPINIAFDCAIVGKAPARTHKYIGIGTRTFSISSCSLLSSALLADRRVRMCVYENYPYGQCSRVWGR